MPSASADNAACVTGCLGMPITTSRSIVVKSTPPRPSLAWTSPPELRYRSGAPRTQSHRSDARADWPFPTSRSGVAAAKLEAVGISGGPSPLPLGVTTAPAGSFRIRDRASALQIPHATCIVTAVVRASGALASGAAMRRGRSSPVRVVGHRWQLVGKSAGDPGLPDVVRRAKDASAIAAARLAGACRIAVSSSPALDRSRARPEWAARC